MITFEEFVNSKTFTTDKDGKFLDKCRGEETKVIEYIDGTFIIDKSEDENDEYELILQQECFYNNDLVVLEKILYEFCVDEIW